MLSGGPEAGRDPWSRGRSPPAEADTQDWVGAEGPGSGSPGVYGDAGWAEFLLGPAPSSLEADLQGVRISPGWAGSHCPGSWTAGGSASLCSSSQDAGRRGSSLPRCSISSGPVRTGLPPDCPWAGGS